MKILCEVPLGVKQFDRSQFRWLKGKENYLFVLENDKRLRIFNIKQDAGIAQEIQSASLAESRHCSSLSWNKDESLLALVVDRKQIYFWDIKKNHFSHFKPRTGQTALVGSTGKLPANNIQTHRKAARAKDIEFVAWSRLSDKLAICYASGQILLCRVVVNNDNNDEIGHGERRLSQQQSYSTTWERFIDNSESLLKRIASIEVCEHAELFTCFSVIAEILIMSFDGQTKFYCQGERTNLFNAKFSPLNREYCPRSGKYLGQSLHLACQSKNDGEIYLKKISLDIEHELHDVPPKLYVPHEQSSAKSYNLSLANGEQRCQQKQQLVDFYWLNSTHIILCLKSGTIQLIQILQNSIKQDESMSISCTELFRINAQNRILSMESGLMSSTSSSSRPSSRNQARHNSVAESVASDRSFATTITSISHTSTNATKSNSNEAILNETNAFKMFELIRTSKKPDCSQCFALAAATNFKLFYYELYEMTSHTNRFSFEHFDDIDISDSLKRVNLELERARWSQDCSMLSLQVTSGQLLVYKTRLQHFMVASYGPRTAYLSSPKEVTILNYGTYSPSSLAYESTIHHDNNQTLSVGEEDADSQASAQTNQNIKPGDNAIILGVQMKPSLLAIGPNHLALALNNRVRFYTLNSRQASKSAHIDAADGQSQMGSFKEQEYITIVVGISLSSCFVAIQFDDGRLKLHSIGQILAEVRDSGDTNSNDGLQDDERFFPDPSQPESISAFTLTEELLVYCTKEHRINVFKLASWSMVQICDHSKLFLGPVDRLKPNDRGNEFVCLVSPELNRSREQDNVFLYHLYSNDVFALLSRGGNNLWPRLVKEQIDATLDILTFDRPRIRKIIQEYRFPVRRPTQLANVVDAIWDTDGRTLLLVELKYCHVFAVLCHTLEQEEPVAEYAASAKKPASYTALYISQGVVSFQTGLGRVINSILETHDDELKLTKLELQIQTIKQKVMIPSQGSPSVIGGGTNRSEDKEEENEDQSSGKSSTLKVDNMLFLEAHLRINLLKLEYLCTILPIYSLPKCRDICKHLMEEDSFNMGPDESIGAYLNEYKLINQLLPKLLASWSLYTLNLGFASLIYQRNNIQLYASLLQNLMNDIKTKKMDSRSWVNNRILSMLSCHDGRTDRK